MKAKLTPQQKKLYSYAKDGRNGLAESRSVANKAIAKRKAKANRAWRRAETIALAKGEESVGRARRRSFHKSPDMPLADYVRIRLLQRSRTKPDELLNAGQRLAQVRHWIADGHLEAHRSLDSF